MNGLFDLEQDLRQQRWRSRAPVMCKTYPCRAQLNQTAGLSESLLNDPRIIYSLWFLVDANSRSAQSGVCCQKLSPASECADIFRDCWPLSRYASVVSSTRMDQSTQSTG